MPDPLRKSISATEASVLFDVNAYCTRWMLYRQFKNGDEAPKEVHARMDWGKKLEPLVLEQAAQDLKLEVRPNAGPDGNQVYVRRGLLGCTRDAEIICPDRGPGALETKCVFDYRTWMTDWKGGNKIPKQHEIQVQTQMHVGDGDKPYSWGVFAVWIAGEVFYYERKPVPDFIASLEKEAARFFEELKAGAEPDPFGVPVEWPLLDVAFPVQENTVLDKRNADDGLAIAEEVRMYEYHRKQRLAHERGEDALKAKLRALAKTNETVLLPFGINFKLKQNKKSVGLKTYVPADLPEGEINYVQ